jgi:hypothetical protein
VDDLSEEINRLKTIRKIGKLKKKLKVKIRISLLLLFKL